MTPEMMISVRVACGIVAAAEREGVTRHELLRAAKLDPALLERESYLPCRVIYQLCDLALELTHDPAFGLHWAERLYDTTFNPVSNLAAQSANLREGLELLSRFHPLFCDQPSFRLTEGAEQVTVHCVDRLGASLRVQRVIAEMHAFGMIRLIRSFSPHARVDSVSFTYPRPSYHAEYTRVLELEPRFDQPRTTIVFDRALMSSASLQRDEDVHDALRAVAEQRIRKLLQRTLFASRVRDVLIDQTRSQPPDMSRVARALGLSRRSLSRRLEAEGSSYKSIVNEALGIVAKQYLREKRLSIQETAYEMGFADSSAFHRAFKRWTGRTPSAYRIEPSA